MAALFLIYLSNKVCTYVREHVRDMWSILAWTRETLQKRQWKLGEFSAKAPHLFELKTTNRKQLLYITLFTALRIIEKKMEE